jgi:hypothetical protein
VDRIAVRAGAAAGSGGERERALAGHDLHDADALHRVGQHDQQFEERAAMSTTVDVKGDLAQVSTGWPARRGR